MHHFTTGDQDFLLLTVCVGVLTEINTYRVSFSLFWLSQTILLEDRQKNLYCVACQELDSDVDKDDPGVCVCVPVCVSVP